MKKKLLLLLVLLMTAATGAWATTVTWEGRPLEGFNLKTGGSFTHDGVTLNVLNGSIIGNYWIGNSPNASFKFSTSSGNFTKIEIYATIQTLGGSGWTQTSPGAVWTGEANETTFGGNFQSVSKIVFTIEPAEPTTYTLQLVVNDPAMGSVAVTNLLGSGIVDNQDGTYTVPENAEVNLLATANEGYKFTGWREGNLNDLVGCYYCGVALNTLENTLTFTMTGDKDVLAKFAALTHAVTFAEGTPEADKWKAEPNTDVKKGDKVTVTYSGDRKVIGVKAEKKATGPVTYTELKGGEVLHVGDIINVPNGEEWELNGAFYISSNSIPYTVVRANITPGVYPGDEPTTTEAEDGDYYVIKKSNDVYFPYLFNSGSNLLPVTSTSDGILVTYNGISYGYKSYTFSVHEP